MVRNRLIALLRSIVKWECATGQRRFKRSEDSESLLHVPVDTFLYDVFGRLLEEQYHVWDRNETPSPGYKR